MAADTFHTRTPARLDRLPWSHFHTLVVVALGVTWIFDGLEVAGVAGADAMDRVLYTPHSVRLEQLATAYGWEYHRCTTRSALDQVLTSAAGGRQLIEVPLER